MKYSDIEADQLLSILARLVGKAVNSYSLPTSHPLSCAQAEFAAFIYFWLLTWQDQQPDAIREYEPMRKLVKMWAQDGCIPC